MMHKQDCILTSKRRNKLALRSNNILQKNESSFNNNSF